jgi:hypothetical protein
MSTQTSPQAPGCAPWEIVGYAVRSTFDQRRRTCNREGREVLKQYLMSMSSEWWKQVSRSHFLLKREVLDYARERLPDSRPPHKHEN